MKVAEIVYTVFPEFPKVLELKDMMAWKYFPVTEIPNGKKSGEMIGAGNGY